MAFYDYFADSEILIGLFSRVDHAVFGSKVYHLAKNKLLKLLPQQRLHNPIDVRSVRFRK